MQSLIQRISQLSLSRSTLIGGQNVRNMSRVKRRSTRPPYWWVKQTRTLYPEELTPANQKFLDESVTARYPEASSTSPIISPLVGADPTWNQNEERALWTPGSRRTGVITKKIGVQPMWMDDGTKTLVTLLQVVDNHVVRYIPPEEWIKTVKGAKWFKPFKGPPKMGVLVVGAESTDPRMFTKEYCGLFENSGLMPKKKLSRFFITPDAKIRPGTPLFASHFRAGDYVDVYGKTIDRGFQGVMKRWGFHGMPKTHGQTKTHRRPGNIGGGGEKARVWPGKKMPGHMGCERRTMRGLKIWRINNQYNVLYVQGSGVPGEIHSYVLVHDTLLGTKKIGGDVKDKTVLPPPPPFPTFYPDLDGEVDEDWYSGGAYQFGQPTITFDAQAQ